MNILVRWPDETKNKDEKILGILFITVFKRLRKYILPHNYIFRPSESISKF